MSITIKPLDGSISEEDVTILVGKNSLLRFEPGDSWMKDKILRNFTMVQNLLKSDLFLKVIQKRELSEEISDKLARFIRYQENIADLRSDESAEKLIRPSLADMQTSIFQISDQIKALEKETGFFCAKDLPFYFCSKCASYLADSIESLPDVCKFCNQKTKTINPNLVRCLDANFIEYFKGLWFEDYIAKILKSLGWKTWCHGFVMGSSGIYHQIDILAISPDGQVLVVECKSGKFATRDVFHFSTKYFDIKAQYGLFAAFKENPNLQGRDYMDRTPGLCLADNLKNLTDLKIVEKIKEVFGKNLFNN